MTSAEVGKTKLGNTGTEISRIGFGTYKLGLKPTPTEAVDLLGHAFDRGVSFIDTSDNYPGAELIIGQALRERRLLRNETVIATKTGLARSEYEARKFQEKGRNVDMSPARVRSAVEGSLRLLGIDTVDLYQVHIHDPAVPSIEIVGVMNDLIREGKIQHWGVSNYNDPRLVSEIVEVSKKENLIGPVSLQDSFSLLDRRYSSAIQSAQTSGLSVLAFSPLYRGALTDRLFESIPAISEGAKGADDPEEKARLGDELAAIQRLLPLQVFAKDHGATFQQLAIAWLMHNEGTVPLLGAYKQEYFDDLLKAAKLRLTDEDLDYIDEVITS